MKFVGPERYKLHFDSKTYSSVCAKGTNRFSGLAITKGPKIYVVSVADVPIYVGATRRIMRERLAYGWKATGKSGYYGYQWRHEMNEANLDIWLDELGVANENNNDVETVEAEIVYLIRSAGQWPKYQTEIHFHQSDVKHRDAARMIFGHYQC